MLIFLFLVISLRKPQLKLKNKRIQELKMSDVIQIINFALAGIDKFPRIPGVVKFDGNVFYHFYSIIEGTQPENKHPFLKPFEIAEQQRVEYTKGTINNKILSGEYEVSDLVEIKKFEQVEFATMKSDSLVKAKISVSDSIRPYFGILTEEEIRDEKFDSITDNVFGNQFLKI